MVSLREPHSTLSNLCVFELFVQEGFCDLELASVITTLRYANELRARDQFHWRFVSDQPGLIGSAGGVSVRADPAIPDYEMADIMVVIGAKRGIAAPWLRRLRSMRRDGLPVVLLSDAASAYIRETPKIGGPVTTHWRNAVLLAESGDYPQLTAQFAASHGGVTTAAGAGATTELILGIIAKILPAHEIAELCNLLLVAELRPLERDQPRNIVENSQRLDPKIIQVMKRMEDSIAEPLALAELAAEINLSGRQLERLFNAELGTSPARFYKILRTKRARTMLRNTKISILDVAIATGFSSTSALSKALRAHFGMTSSAIRAKVGDDSLAE
jgi:transcriptional regulator GlxA family with amidase domain